MFPINFKSNIRRLLFIGFLIISFNQAFSQNSTNYMQVTSTASSFNLNSATALENSQVLTKAIRLGINSRTYNYSVYVKVTNFSYPAGSSIDNFSLGIKLNSVSISGTSYPNYNTVYLSLTDQRIAQGTKTSALGYWYYDFILDPVGYDAMPGVYGATLLFTMTQP